MDCHQRDSNETKNTNFISVPARAFVVSDI